MSVEEIRRRLQANIDFYNRAAWSIHDLELVAYELAGYIEPAEVLSLLPEPVQQEIAKIAERPFPRRENWLVTGSVCVERDKMDAYLKALEIRENKQYEGMYKFYVHFTGHQPPGVTPGKWGRPRKTAKQIREETREINAEMIRRGRPEYVIPEKPTKRSKK